MNEKDKNYPTSDEREAAAAARRLSDLDETPNYARRRLAAATIAGGVLVGGVIGVQAITNEIKANEQATEIKADYQADQDFLTAIQTEALQPADPLDIQGNYFQVGEEGFTTLFDEAKSIAVNLENYQTNQDLIDYTLLESAKAQGMYHEGEFFAVTPAEIEGQSTYIVQPVEDVNDIQLPTESTLPAPETH
jgi:hypothetical protein